MPAKGSIFSHKLDRVAFTAYFLGAIVPLLALGFITHRYVFPTLTDRLATFGLIGLLLSIGVLTLGAFLTLRTTARRSLEQMDRDNRQLAGLLDASRGLAAMEHAEDAARSAAQAALALGDADAAYVLVRGEPGQPPARLAAAGDDAEKIEQDQAECLLESAKLVMSQWRPSVRGPGDGGPAVAAAPLPDEAAPCGALVVLRRDGRDFDPSQLDALGALAGLTSVSLRNAELRESQRNFFIHVTDILVSALDSQEGSMTGHGTRVAQLANRIGRQLGLDDHRLQRLHFAALLHDIGMLKIDAAFRTSGKTSAKHPVLGARMLARIKMWEDLAPIVHHHHEWWDGSGYPDQLSAGAIPLESRIIALCDAWDVMTSSTSYKTPQPRSDCIDEMRRHAGTQFDPDVVGAFEDLLAEGVIE